MFHFSERFMSKCLFLFLNPSVLCVGFWSILLTQALFFAKLGKVWMCDVAEGVSKKLSS